MIEYFRELLSSLNEQRYRNIYKKALENYRDEILELRVALRELRQEVDNERSESFIANAKVDALAEKLGYEVVGSFTGEVKVFSIPSEPKK